MKGWPNDQAGPGEINSPTHFAGAAGRSSVDKAVLDALDRLEKWANSYDDIYEDNVRIRFPREALATVRDRLRTQEQELEQLREERDALIARYQTSDSPHN